MPRTNRSGRRRAPGDSASYQMRVLLERFEAQHRTIRAAILATRDLLGERIDGRIDRSEFRHRLAALKREIEI